MSDETTEMGDIDRRTVLRNVAVGAVGLSGLVGSVTASQDGQTDALDAEPMKKDCYTETKCEDDNLYRRECCPYVIYPDGGDCGPWEDTGTYCDSSNWLN